MRIRLHFIVVLLLCCANSADALYASDLRLSEVESDLTAPVQGRPSAEFSVRWNNSWRHDRNYDAAWIFLKADPGSGWGWQHVRLAHEGHRVLADSQASGPAPELLLAPDRMGLFVQPSAAHRGEFRCRLSLALDPSSFERFPQGHKIELAALGVEMVYIPEGPFTLGDPGEEALQYGSFYKSGPGGNPNGLVRIESEAAIEVGPQAGMLHYRNHTRPRYEGDQGGPVPAAFPKGYRAFYIMKYELSQGEYARFLNLVTDRATFRRAPQAGRSYYQLRGTITLQNGRYVAVSPDRPGSFVSWDDGCAFADWAGLRPMTELEFVKAARGPAVPRSRGFPWGTSSADSLLRVVGPDSELARSGAADESRLSDDNRALLGASHYWVMDLAGSVWERVVSIGHPNGRAFRGSHGDGALTELGEADVEDWPRGDDYGGGFGYRGGGFYEHGQPAGAFNPYSPVGYRRYGGWGAGPRYHAYGFRGVRTAPSP